MSVHLSSGSFQRINFAIGEQEAEAEINGNLAFIYINQKKITLKIDPNQQSLDTIENYLNSNKEKIINFLHQHQVIEEIYKNKKIRLLEGGRFQYYTDKGRVKDTTLQEEYTELKSKLLEFGPKEKWVDKLDRIEKAIKEFGIVQDKKSKPGSHESVIRPSLALVEENSKYITIPIKDPTLKVIKENPVREIAEKHRRAVRNKTKKKVDEDVFIQTGQPRKHFHSKKIFKQARLYRSIPSNNKTFLNNLDVVQVPIKVDFDETWIPILYNKKDESRWQPEEFTKVAKVKADKYGREKAVKGKKLLYQKPPLGQYRPPKNTFFCHYTPALKISKNGPYFSANREFNEEKYIEDTGVVYLQALRAQKASGASHILWNPFGMEDHLRRLGVKDGTYRDKVKLNELKYKLALKFREQFERDEFRGLQLHLCLSTGKGIKRNSLKRGAIENYNAFVSAFFSSSEEVKDRIMVHPNADMPVVAQELAEKEGEGKVSMIQAANPKTLGNNWLEHPDQGNLHCRSSSAAIVACLLDQGISKKAKTENLEKRIEKLGGRVVFI